MAGTGLHSARAVTVVNPITSGSFFFSCSVVFSVLLFAFFPLLHVVGIFFGSSKEAGCVFTGESFFDVVEEQVGFVGLALSESFQVERLQDEH